MLENPNLHDWTYESTRLILQNNIFLSKHLLKKVNSLLTFGFELVFEFIAAYDPSSPQIFR